MLGQGKLPRFKEINLAQKHEPTSFQPRHPHALI